MDLITRFLEETNYVVQRMLQEYNSFDEKDETKWQKVSTQLTDFVQEVKTDERIPKIVGASVVSDLHKAYMVGTSKIFMHELNMHLMTVFTDEEYKEMSQILGRSYYNAMRCNTVDGKAEITQVDATGIFINNPWLISLYAVRMNFFTPIVSYFEDSHQDE